MSSSPETAVPSLLAERFAATFANLVGALDWAAQAAPNHPGFTAHAALAAITQRALPALTTQLASVNAAMAAYTAGDPGALLAAARQARTLSRDLDGFDLNINRTGDFVREELTFVVMAAYQVVAAAGGA